MPITFTTPDEFDLNCLFVFGLHAKPNSESPIGYFGTGLKYAIAILLRNKAQIFLTTPTAEYTFDTELSTFRNTEQTYINLVDTLSGHTRRLPFNLTLGKNWELWQAFRELHSNTLDEGGKTRYANHRPQGSSAGCTITVVSTDFEGIFFEKDQIFLPETLIPLYENDSMQIFPKQSPYIYYRGIKTSRPPVPSLYTYNYLGTVTLTEDRTLHSVWPIEKTVREIVLSESPPKVYLKSIFYALPGTHERDIFAFAGNIDSLETQDYLLSLARRDSNNLTPWANIEVHRIERDRQINVEEPLVLSPEEKTLFNKAAKLCARVGQIVPKANIRFVQTLGPQTYGAYRSNEEEILIAKLAFDSGFRQLFITLLEETIHYRYGYMDESRNLQEFLLHQWVSLIERHYEETGL